jgi:hypothetical protein
MGSGIGNLDDIYNTAVSHEQGVGIYQYFFVQRLIIMLGLP